MMEVVVSAPYRRRGVATAMYRAVEEQAGRQLKPAVSLSDDGFEFWKAYRPEAVAEDLRHRLDELIGRRGVKHGREGIITKASGGTATLTHPDGMHTTILRRELDDVLLPLEPDDGPGDGPGGPGGLPAGTSGDGAVDEGQGAAVDAEDETTDTLTGAPAFRAWFGDSKVVDADGRPLVVYHGTATDFESFDNAKTGANDGGLWGRGHYFAANPEVASSYAMRQGDEARVVPAYVAIKNPLILKTGADLVTRLPDGTNTKDLVGPNLDGKKIKDIAVSGGHDGVIQIRPNGVIGDVVAYDAKQIKSAIGNNGDFDAQNPDIRFSFAGVQAATADVATLADAKALLAAGEDAETVRQKTHWFQGVDGAWRFEINDAQAQLKNLRQGEDGVASRATYLADVLHHPALFAAYPSLRNLDVMIDIDPAKAVRGSFEAGTPGDALFFGRTPELHVVAPSPEAALGCLLHEIQHALQDIEGFAEGGSPKLMDAYGDKTPSTDFLYGMVKWNRWMRLCGYPDDKLMDPFADLALNTEDVILADLETQGIWLASQAGISDGVIEEQMQRAFGNSSPQALSVFAARSAYEQYLRLAGEVEARNVEARRAMTDAQRLAASPASTQDVPGDEIIISVNGNAVQSLRVPADAKRNERQTDTQAFRNWFGGSKVVDADGSPLVVYHGTVVRPDTDKVKGMGDIQVFDRLFTTQFRAPSLDTVGSWFSTNPGQGGAEMYSGNHPGSAIYPVYLSIQNPQVTTFQLLQRRARLLANGKDDGRQIGAPEVDAYRQWLKATGKDGIKIEGSGNEGSTEFDQQEAWIALEPEQIKSAIGNNGDFDPENLDIRFSVPEAPAPAPVFFSALAKEVASLPARSNTTDGWIELINGLAKAGKVRDDEVRWTGLADWLFQMEAQQRRITRAELVSYLEENSVRVEEVELGSSSLPWVVVDQATGGDKFYKECATEAEALDLVAEMGDGRYGALPPQDAPNAGRLTGPKYAKYTLPGGSNYREVLLTLSGGEKIGSYAAWLAKRLEITEDEAEERPEYEDDNLHATFMAEHSFASKGYVSTHWDQPNVLAHIRLNDRIDVHGRKTLFVEEIQSDWAQQGRKFGFVDDRAGDRMPGLLGQYDTLNARRRELEAKLAKGGTQADFQAVIEVGGQMEALAEEMTRIRSIPLGPFVGKTDGWLGLSLRRIMKMAVDGGYDNVAFVSGEQASGHFLLSKQVDEIEAFKSGSDTYGLRIDPIEGDRFYKSGLSAQGLEDHVGKDMAASLIEAADQYGQADGVYRAALRQTDVPQDVLDDLLAKRDAV
ncbi:MAG: hypothetical protein K2W33_09345, partial [Burkholderiales bacterium]|nr:hypothetical protein [Burkholderiales bacterium]